MSGEVALDFFNKGLRKLALYFDTRIGYGSFNISIFDLMIRNSRRSG